MVWGMRCSAPDQRGQTLPSVVLFMFGLLGMCALAIDVGSWYQEKRSAQSAADAGALAGAAFLPVNWSSAQSQGGQRVRARTRRAATPPPTRRQTTFVANDTIQVQVTRPAPAYFARVFGKTTINTVVTAKATMMNNGGGAMPWGVMKGTYTAGTTYQIYTDNSGPNNGAVRLPAWDTRQLDLHHRSANGMGGAALYTAQIQGGIVTTCPLTINQVISTKTGNNTGPTSQGVDNRCPALAGAHRDRQLRRPHRPAALQLPAGAAAGGRGRRHRRRHLAAHRQRRRPRRRLLLVGDQGLRQRRQDRRRRLRRPRPHRPQRRLHPAPGLHAAADRLTCTARRPLRVESHSNRAAQRTTRDHASSATGRCSTTSFASAHPARTRRSA